MGYLEDVEYEVSRTEYIQLRHDIAEVLEYVGKKAFDNSEFEDGRLIYEGLQSRDEESFTEDIISLFEDFFQISIKRIDYKLDTVRVVEGEHTVRKRKVVKQ